MSFGDGDLHVIVAQLKTENARLKQRNGELERLVREIMTANADETVRRRMTALEIEVDT